MGSRARLACILVVFGLSPACANDSGASGGLCSALQGTPPPPEDRGDDFGLFENHAFDRSAPICKFGRGDLTKKTIGADAPRPPDDAHVVVVMLENRSFDNYLNGVEGTDYARDESNPDVESAEASTGQYHERNYRTKDTTHEWGPSHLQFDNGKMDGFVAVSQPCGRRAMGYFTEEDLPFAHWLAKNYAVSDRHFSSVMGPTWPNRIFSASGTSCGHTEGADSNPWITIDCGLKKASLFTLLRDAEVSYGVYDASGPASVTVGLGVDHAPAPLVVPRSIDDLRKDVLGVDGRQLPSFAMVGANTGQMTQWGLSDAPENDDHPPSDVRRGELFVYDVVQALMANPDVFAKTILFVTYDENGGLFDHVVPPDACPPADESAKTDYRFDRLGFRVPMLIVSPYVKRSGYVSHYVTDHTSITRFVEHWLQLGALTNRDANAWPFLDVFDFGRSSPVPELPGRPQEPVDPTLEEAAGIQLEQCTTAHRPVKG